MRFLCDWKNLTFAPWAWLALAAGLFVNGRNLTADDQRYVVRYVDGAYHSGEKLVNWQSESAQPQVDGRSLFHESNPFRWLRDRAQSPGEAPTAGMELITGDFLPGEVLSYVADDVPWLPEQPYFVVQPSVALDPPESPPQSTVRVIASHVKRIIWQRSRSDAALPNTLKLRDGSTFTFRALRWGANSVQVLMTGGNRRFEFSELAEITPSSAPFWTTYEREAAVLSPTGKTRLLSLETVHGLSITASLERFAIHSRGNHEEPHRWCHGLQPAWSRDLLWVPVESIWMWRSFAPHEVPLQRIPPTHVEHTAVLQPFTAPWRIDRNIRGEWLRSGKHEIGFGLGTGTTTTLTFELPAIARRLQGAVGLDRLAGSGGCVKVKIAAGAAEMKTLWESPTWQGSQTTHDFTALPLPNVATNDNASTFRLQLTADAAQADRPAGADPFEVRDYVDWLEPVVSLDESAWREKLRQAAPLSQLAGSAWQLSLPSTAESPVVNVFDRRAPVPRGYVPALASSESFAWRQTVSLTPQTQWLLVYVNRLTEQEADPQLEVRIAGERIDRVKISRRDDSPHRDRPHVFPIADFAQAMKSVEIELRVLNAHPKSPVLLRSAFVAERLPFVQTVFDGSTLPKSTLPAEATAAATPPQFVVDGERSPAPALKIMAGGSATFTFDPPLKIRSQPQAPECRALRMSFKPHACTHFFLKWTGNFEAGGAEHVVGKVERNKKQFRIHNETLKTEWHHVTHDVYNDLGETEITSLTISVPNGEFLLLDELYLADTWEDFLLLEKAFVPFTDRAAHLTQRITSQLERAQQCTVRIDFGEGRTSYGVLVGGNQEILTAGKLVREPNRECTVFTADGKQHQARTAGVCREYDLGMVRLEKSAGIHGLGINHWLQPGPQLPWITTSFPTPGAATAQLAEVLRANDRLAWSNVPGKQQLLGGPLLDKDAHVIGIAHRQSVTGNLVYSLLHKWSDIEKRLQNNEVWGEFPQE